MARATVAWLQIHLCVVLWGFTAILGKLIALPALPLVLWRMGLVALALCAWPRVWRAFGALPARTAVVYAGIGVLVALHWLTFYGAVKLANASVAATCMALVPVFVSVVEPLLTRRGFEPRELWLALLAAPGVALVVGGTPQDMNLGIGVGVVSALLAACFGTLNKRAVPGADPFAMTAQELGAGALFLAVFAALLLGLDAGAAAETPEWVVPLAEQASARALLGPPSSRDVGLLLVLALACTLIPFSLSLVALRRLSAYDTALAVNLEPVYAIALAVLMLDEQRELGPRFYLGAALVLGVVFSYPLLGPRPLDSPARSSDP